MNFLVKEVVEDLAKKIDLRKSGTRWVSDICPSCGRSSSGNGNKFMFDQDGGFKCWGSCGIKGDIINVLRGDRYDFGYSMTCAEAHEYVNVGCLSHTCPYMTKCRVTSGCRRSPKKSGYFQRNKSQSEINIIESVFFPHDKWVDRMSALVDKAAAKIGHENEVLGYLARRGVNREIVQANKFGWLPHDESIPIEELGMVYDPDGSVEVAAGTITYDKKRLWVPGGIVMPLYSNGRLFAVDIRRTTEAQSKFAHNIKYMFVKGGGVAYRSLWSGAPEIKPRAIALIESRLDASMVAHYCPDVAFIVGKDKPLSRLYAEHFRKSDVFLICTDNDQPNKKGLRAGEEKAKDWEREFQNAHFWPVPKGKDPGEFFEQGGDVKKWIYSGIEKFSGNFYQPTPRQEEGSSGNTFQPTPRQEEGASGNTFQPTPQQKEDASGIKKNTDHSHPTLASFIDQQDKQTATGRSATDSTPPRIAERCIDWMEFVLGLERMEEEEAQRVSTFREMYANWIAAKKDKSPYLDKLGIPRIPIDCDPKYRHWEGGQPLLDTLLELGASDNVINMRVTEEYSPEDWRRWQEIKIGR